MVNVFVLYSKGLLWPSSGHKMNNTIQSAPLITAAGFSSGSLTMTIIFIQ